MISFSFTLESYILDAKKACIIIYEARVRFRIRVRVRVWVRDSAIFEKVECRYDRMRRLKNY